MERWTRTFRILSKGQLGHQRTQRPDERKKKGIERDRRESRGRNGDAQLCRTTRELKMAAPRTKRNSAGPKATRLRLARAARQREMARGMQH